MSETVDVGVIGVGSMGQNHARIYGDLPGANLVGVADADAARAAAIAGEYDTDPYEIDELIDEATAVSIAVPTQFHFPIARKCVEAGTNVLVEKPLVDDPADGQTLLDLADENDVTLQVGHVERFNPAVRTLSDIASDLDVISVTAERLGPPRDREIDDSAVMDLMIHDVDIVLALLGERPTNIVATGVRNNEHAVATMEFGSDTVAELTASRVTQERVRQLTITAEDARVKLDYRDQTIEIHRRSSSEYVNAGGIRYRRENTVEQLTVDQGEPLEEELDSYLDAVRTDEEPVVTGEDGLRALEVTQRIDRLADGDSSGEETGTVTPAVEETD